jgi:hypothetical protein
MAVLELLLALPSVTSGPGWFDAPGCVPGFCPLPVRLGPPPGLMYLAVGIVAFGVGGIWRRRA